MDIKVELLDHMVCDIESIMEDKAMAFEDAFYQVKNKWKSHFNATSNMWMGLLFVKPKIVIDKCGAIMQKTILYSIGTAIAVSLVVFLLSQVFSFDTTIINAYAYKMRWIFFATTLSISGYHSWQILRKKAKTVFGYCYLRQFAFSPLFFLLIYPSKISSIMSAYYPLFYLTIIFTYYYFALKTFAEHRKYERQYLKLT